MKAQKTKIMESDQEKKLFHEDIYSDECQSCRNAVILGLLLFGVGLLLGLNIGEIINEVKK